MELYCICTEQICGHAPGQQCGKPISQSNAKPYVLTNAGLQESGEGICDECWERIRPDKRTKAN
jgi:hypothetical protein